MTASPSPRPTPRPSGPGRFGERAALPEADALVEALPWMARHHGRTVVIKSGGTAMVDDDRISADAELQRSFEGAVA